ncbi:MAG: matrixin family metalloprotease [Bacteroidetes bacterium]|nr:matrixin family metalloprotease [Bacteroidota bacterium]
MLKCLVASIWISLSLFNTTGISANKNSGSAVVIDIQPFEGVDEQDVDYLVKELLKVYPNIHVNKAVKLPAFAWYAPRKRFKADSLLKFLSSVTKPGHVIIGLTSKDISTTKNNHPDWGVMGLGLCPGNSCVASSFRLSTKERRMQLFKVAIHELGHTQGLPHCAVKSCYMRDAEGRNPTNEEKEFCSSCKKFLIKKGWNFR